MSIFMDSLNFKKTKKTPIWFMRQAGRHLPEYMEVRSGYRNLMEMFKDSSVCSKVTLQPVERYDLDAAIIFTDILMIHMIKGANVSFDKPGGPIVEFKSKEKTNFNNINFLYEAIKITKNKTNKPLIGFAGGPWTTLTYSMFSPTERKELQKHIKHKEKEIEKKIKEITELTIEHGIRQTDSGIDAFQLFESAAGILEDEQLNRWCIEPCKLILKEIKKHKNIPTIVFPRGVSLKNYVSYSNISNLNCLSIDQFFNLKNISKLNTNKTIQGNLDPKTLRLGGKKLEREIHKILLAFRETPHIFNLGHGVIKDTPTTNVADAVDTIRS
jgi:uroporphyrinogen decarboxylase